MTTDPVSDPVYYRLACVADGTILVDGGSLPQSYAGAYSTGQPGWQTTTMHFMDSCNPVADGTVWCIYYEFAALSPTTLNGTCIVVSPAGIENRFTAVAEWQFP